MIYHLVPVQDGTLTDSIAAVEAAWAKVARDIGQDPDFVIASTHGKRAIDNFALFKPHLKEEEEIEREVQRFEESILWFADAYNRHDPGFSTTSSEYTNIALTPPSSSPPGTGSHTPALVRSANGSDVSLSLSSTSSEDDVAEALLPRNAVLLNPSLSQRVLNFLNLSSESVNDTSIQSSPISGDAECLPLVSDDDLALDVVEDDIPMISLHNLESLKPTQKLSTYVPEAWQLEAASVDRSVRILPGVRKMISSIPDGRYAIATSGAKTYGEPNLLTHL